MDFGCQPPIAAKKVLNNQINDSVVSSIKKAQPNKVFFQ
jgi:hypothetical protein